MSFLPSVPMLILCILCPPVVGGTDASEQNRPSGQPPNIIYVMADDMGLGDVKCFGKEKSLAQTPHIDRLAREGMMLTDAHAPVAHCIPTRVAVMTGRYHFRFSRPHRSGPWGFIYPQFNRGHATLATMLKAAGYHTAYIGKWHLGLDMPTTDGRDQGPGNVDYSRPFSHGPNDHGFDESFILPGSLDMYPYEFARNQKWLGKVNAQKGWSAFNRVGPAEQDFEDYKVLDAFCRESEKYIASRAGPKSPFFLYLALTAPHTPTSPSPKFRGRSRLGLYRDFLMETDHCLGRIVQSLEKHGLEGNTLVVFTSDHGAASYAGNLARATVGQYREMQKMGHFSSGIYRGYKFSAYEGGTRIPLVVKFPGRIGAGSVCDRLVGLNDMMATFAEVAGAHMDRKQATDSFSFASLFSRPTAPSARDFMICRSTNAFTVRQGDWKLLLCPGAGCHGKWGNSPARATAWKQAVAELGHRPLANEIRRPEFCQLFNLREDPAESNDLSTRHPERILEMGRLLDRVIANGRSTPGPPLKNDRRLDPLQDVPRFVLPR
ncbi:MAG: arylsulfatase [Planctomycetota bacterium]|nr:arylsulfatase [Planctomycetota bacterium]